MVLMITGWIIIVSDSLQCRVMLPRPELPMALSLQSQCLEKMSRVQKVFNNLAHPKFIHQMSICHKEMDIRKFFHNF